MVTTSTLPTLEAVEQLVDMGMEEGTVQMDEILAARPIGTENALVRDLGVRPWTPLSCADSAIDGARINDRRRVGD